MRGLLAPMVSCSAVEKRTRRVVIKIMLATAICGPADTVAAQEPSRADTLLAQGRLRAAEEELYAAVASSPREPAARGELARYLASRARFVIADVLFAEAMRFGADTPAVAQSLMAIAPFRPEVDRRTIAGVRLPVAESARERARLDARAAGASAIGSEGVTIPFDFAQDGRTIGRFEVRGVGGVVSATLDPSVSGLLVRSASDPMLTARSFGAIGRGAPLIIDEIWIGSARLTGVEARVDPDLPPGEIRVGLDVIWPLRVIFDESRGTITIPARGSSRSRAVRPSESARQVPFALSFPGVWLIPTAGRPPQRIEARATRALLADSRWWFDSDQATLVVER